MNKLIYTKYSNERADRFRIRTDIWQDGEEQRYVEKRPMHEAAKAHVQAIKKHEEILNELLAGTDIRVNRCERAGERVRLEYLDGQNMEESLDVILAESSAADVIVEMERYFHILCGQVPQVTFAETEEFVQVFGKAEALNGKTAFAAANIDMIFSNVLKKDGEKTLIDYEWTFDFAIPVHFIIYRCIHYYINGNSKRAVLDEKALHEHFGVTDEEILVFSEMEEKFQSYMLDGMTPIRHLYEVISPGCTDMKPILNDLFAGSDRRRVQVYYDSGAGYSEVDSRFYPAGREAVKIKIPVTDAVRALRIDPCSSGCTVYLKKLASDKGPVNVRSNGVCTGDDMYLFESDDPQFLIDELPAGTTVVEAEFYVSVLEGLSQNAVRSLVNRLEQTTDQVKQMENSKAWKANEQVQKWLGRR